MGVHGHCYESDDPIDIAASVSHYQVRQYYLGGNITAFEIIIVKVDNRQTHQSPTIIYSLCLVVTCAVAFSTVLLQRMRISS